MPRREQYSYSITFVLIASVITHALPVPVMALISHVKLCSGGLPSCWCKLFSTGDSGHSVKVIVYGAPPLAVAPFVHVTDFTLSNASNAALQAAASVFAGLASKLVLWPLNVILTVPDSVPEVAEVVTVMARLTWPVVSGSSPLGHIWKLQSGPVKPISQLQAVAESLSQLV